MTQTKKLEGFSELKLLNKTSYNELILAQEDAVCFYIVEDAKTKANKYTDARQACMKVSRKMIQQRGIPRQYYTVKISKCKLDYAPI